MPEKEKSNYIDLGAARQKKHRYPQPKQSANTLFNFMPRGEYLKKILTQKAIVPRYVREDLSYLDLSISAIAIPMTCFCDINIPWIEDHTKTYGKYGIAFYKDWCIEQHIQPIHYINPDSHVRQDFQQAFQTALRIPEKDEPTRILSNYLLSHLLYMKPLYGQKNGSDKTGINYHDEREWRYVPPLSQLDTDMPMLLNCNADPAVKIEKYNAGLQQCHDAWLTFSWENIKYILVPTESARNTVARVIMEKCQATKLEKYELLTKIVILAEWKEDV